MYLLPVEADKCSARSSPRRRRSFETFCKNKIEESQHPYGMPSFFYGLSHGLKIARPLSIFTPVCALVPPFRVPFFRCTKKEEAFSLLFFGTPEGTRTPNPRNRNPMLYPLSHRCMPSQPKYYSRLLTVCKEEKTKLFLPFSTKRRTHLRPPSAYYRVK